MLAVVVLLAGACAQAGSVPVSVAGGVDGFAFEIPEGPPYPRGAPGSVVPVLTVDVDKAFQGLECNVAETSTNNESTHPNTDILLASGGATVEILDVETESNATSTGSGSLVLGSTIAASIRLGADGVSSLGFTVAVDCTSEKPTPDPTPEPPCDPETEKCEPEPTPEPCDAVPPGPGCEPEPTPDGCEGAPDDCVPPPPITPPPPTAEEVTPTPTPTPTLIPPLVVTPTPTVPPIVPPVHTG
jgi:hypothetical protein